MPILRDTGAKEGDRVMFKRFLFVVITVALTWVTFGCGGSSSGDSLAPTPTPTPAPTGELPITDDNARAITVTVLDAVTSVIDLTDVANLTGLGLPDLAVVNSKQSVIRATVVDTVDCDTGSAEVTWNDADDSFDISTGDTMDAVLTACFLDDPQITLDGGVSVTDLVMTGEVLLGIPPFSMSTTLGFTDLSGTDSEGTAVINGAMGLSVGTTDGLVTEASITSDSLSAAEDGETMSLTNFVINETFDLNALTTTIDSSGTLDSSELNGSVEFETTQSFVLVGDEDPFTGQIRIADHTSSLLMTVLDNVNLQIEVDADGDGTPETTLNLTWLDLDLD